eukprot:PLAT3959.2.p1 GENE.PLAT3959.2~~PLAT3959.2.p1  ORF type:complete len:659 (+),score=300.58 PLAT3959.2:139-1977(+)
MSETEEAQRQTDEESNSNEAIVNRLAEEDVIVVSVVGGRRDTQVLSSLGQLSGLVSSSHGFATLTAHVPHVGFSIDHRALVWCKQLVNAVVDGLNGAAAAADRSERMAALRSALLTSWPQSAMELHDMSAGVASSIASPSLRIRTAEWLLRVAIGLPFAASAVVAMVIACWQLAVLLAGKHDNVPTLYSALAPVQTTKQAVRAFAALPSSVQGTAAITAVLFVMARAPVAAVRELVPSFLRTVFAANSAANAAPLWLAVTFGGLLGAAFLILLDCCLSPLRLLAACLPKPNWTLLRSVTLAAVLTAAVLVAQLACFGVVAVLTQLRYAAFCCQATVMFCLCLLLLLLPSKHAHVAAHQRVVALLYLALQPPLLVGMLARAVEMLHSASPPAVDAFSRAPLLSYNLRCFPLLLYLLLVRWDDVWHDGTAHAAGGSGDGVRLLPPGSHAICHACSHDDGADGSLCEDGSAGEDSDGEDGVLEAEGRYRVISCSCRERVKEVADWCSFCACACRTCGGEERTYWARAAAAAGGPAAAAAAAAAGGDGYVSGGAGLHSLLSLAAFVAPTVMAAGSAVALYRLGYALTLHATLCGFRIMLRRWQQRTSARLFNRMRM